MKHDKLSRERILNEILSEVHRDLDDEEIIHLLLDRKISSQNIRKKDSFGDIMADRLANFAGSWAFILLFGAIIFTWMMINAFVFMENSFDPYPFILLNLVLSCVSALQAPLIMMSQRRTEEKDRERNENDYKVNLKTEFIMSDIHEKLDLLIEVQAQLIAWAKEEKADDDKAKGQTD